jgi:hypothetical protein
MVLAKALVSIDTYVQWLRRCASDKMRWVAALSAAVKSDVRPLAKQLQYVRGILSH